MRGRTDGDVVSPLFVVCFLVARMMDDERKKEVIFQLPGILERKVEQENISVSHNEEKYPNNLGREQRRKQR